MMDIFDAADSGDVVTLKRYLSSGGDPHATIERAWAQSISYAGWDSKHPKIVECVVEHLKATGENLNGIATHDVLETCCIVGDLKMVKYLHEQGVDLRPHQDWFLSAAKECNQTEIVQFIQRVRPEITPR